jgi:iron complex transport system permease protein
MTTKKNNIHKLLAIAVLAVGAIILYMTINVRFDNPKLLRYSMSIRAPKVIVMLLVAFCIGGASMVFQSVINNTMVTPCLLGMNSLYTLIHTTVAFFSAQAV